MTDEERVEVCQQEIKRLHLVARGLENALEQRDNCIAELRNMLSDMLLKIDSLYMEKE